MTSDFDKAIDPKILARIRALLAMARHGASNEHEADTALSMAQKLMGEHHLQEAALEAAGDPVGARLKDRWTGRAMFKWQRDIIMACADACYCHAETYRSSNHEKVSNSDNTAKGWRVIGRESSIVAMRIMADYLFDTVTRLTGEHAKTMYSTTVEKSKHSFRIGLAERLAERLAARRKDQEAEQREAAKAETERRRVAGTLGALVIVLEDWGLLERELNQDAINGLPPGTTTACRKENEARWAEYDAQADERRAAKKAKRAALRLEHPAASERLIELMADYGHTLAEAQAFVAKMDAPKVYKPETDLQRQRREEKNERDTAAYWAQQERKRAKFDQDALSAGRRAADTVGLDTQVDRQNRKVLNA